MQSKLHPTCEEIQAVILFKVGQYRLNQQAIMKFNSIFYSLINAVLFV